MISRLMLLWEVLTEQRYVNWTRIGEWQCRTLPGCKRTRWKYRKENINRCFPQHRLEAQIVNNYQIVNFLDITLYFNNGKFRTYGKTSNNPQYIDMYSRSKSLLKLYAQRGEYYIAPQQRDLIPIKRHSPICQMQLQKFR